MHHLRRNGRALDGFSHALLWLHQLWLAQHDGRGLNLTELVDASNQPYIIHVDEMINTLLHAHLIHANSNGEFMLSRDLTQLSLYQLSQLLPYRLPSHSELHLSTPSFNKSWLRVFNKNDELLQESLAIKLDELFQSH